MMSSLQGAGVRLLDSYEQSIIRRCRRPVVSRTAGKTGRTGRHRRDETLDVEKSSVKM